MYTNVYRCKHVNENYSTKTCIHSFAEFISSEFQLLGQHCANYTLMLCLVSCIINFHHTIDVFTNALYLNHVTKISSWYSLNDVRRALNKLRGETFNK